MTDNTSHASATPKSAAARLFDIRLLIGGLFLLYGVMLTVAGLSTSDAERAKAAGININLWLGISMLALGALFVLWLTLRPLRVEPNPVTTRDELGDPGRSTGSERLADPGDPGSRA